MPVECERLRRPRKPEASVARNVTANAADASEKCEVGQWTYIACDEHVVRLTREAARYPLADFIH